MRYVRITAMAMAVAALAAGCTGGTAAAANPSVAASAFPAVFAASFSFTSATSQRGDLGERIGLLSSRTGHLLRWLTPRRDGEFDAVLSVHDGWVYFLRGVARLSVWRVPVAGGRAVLVQAGATDYAISPDGRAVAYVISGLHLDVAEIVARNLVTGRQNTIIMATEGMPGANNWPPGISGLTWAPDDTHLAVQFYPTAAINSVLVFDAFTATTIRAGRTAPAPCADVGSPACGEFDPAYLAGGALTYVIQRVSSGGTARASLVAWRAGRRTTLLSLSALPPSIYVTAQGQVIWAVVPAQPKGAWTIWRWTGGNPVKITTLLSAYDGVGGIAW
jgi:hypothetical protein